MRHCVVMSNDFFFFIGMKKINQTVDIGNFEVKCCTFINKIGCYFPSTLSKFIKKKQTVINPLPYNTAF